MNHMRTCATCNTLKPIGDYPNVGNGHGRTCKTCQTNVLKGADMKKKKEPIEPIEIGKDEVPVSEETKPAPKPKKRSRKNSSAKVVTLTQQTAEEYLHRFKEKYKVKSDDWQTLMYMIAAHKSAPVSEITID